jgi:putative endopeptidase
VLPVSLRRLTLSIAIVSALGACGSDTPPPAPAPIAAAPVDAPVIVVDDSKLTALTSLKAADLNTDIAACQDFAGMVNSRWLAANPVPADRTTWGSFDALGERSRDVQRQLVEGAATLAKASGTEKLIGDIWATGMDEAAIEAAGLTPIQDDLSSIEALTDGPSVASWLRANFAAGEGFLFGFGPEADFKDSSMNIAYAVQGGLGLPDRDYYSGDREDYQQARDNYLKHIEAVLTLAGATPDLAARQAQAVMAFETRLAKASLSSEELSRDISKYYNPVDISQADAISPNFPWSAFFDAHGIERPAMFSLAQPDFHKEVSSMLADTPVDDWKAYLRFHTIDSASPYLSDAYVQQNFRFYSQQLRGQAEIQPRWKRVLGAVNGTVGEALGQIYVEHAFPPESKAKMEVLVQNLRNALKPRLENLAWMSPETKAKALEKWATFTPKIGYPEKWRDWSGLVTSRESYAGNLLAANAFNYQWNLGKIGKPVDRSEWGMTPQTVNASYNPLANEITFPAAILQPPFFDPNADPALNYGGIGAVIGHEIIHGYDDQGSRFDAKGSFANWWTDADRQGFESRTGKLVEQFDAYESIEGIHVNGKLTLGENIADLGGLAIAYDALQAALAADPSSNRDIDGYTQAQRFFLNWAVVWRRNFKPEELKVRLTTDPHAPANFRAIGAPSNMPLFAEAFGCKPGDPMVREGERQVVIW